MLGIICSKRGGAPQHRSHFVRIWDYAEDGMILSLGTAKDHTWVRAKALPGEEEGRRPKMEVGEEVSQSSCRTRLNLMDNMCRSQSWT